MGTTGTGLPSQYAPVLTMAKKMASAQTPTAASMRNGQVRAVTSGRAEADGGSLLIILGMAAMTSS